MGKKAEESKELAYRLAAFLAQNDAFIVIDNEGEAYINEELLEERIGRFLREAGEIK